MGFGFDGHLFMAKVDAWSMEMHTRRHPVDSVRSVCSARFRIETYFGWIGWDGTTMAVVSHLAGRRDEG